ncbi:MAG: hypothetical protein DDT19_00654 [Syntrophomonadaceae bacterium]|nr:hypothetical protein [Bacillota bacterium]
MAENTKNIEALANTPSGEETGSDKPMASSSGSNGVKPPKIKKTVAPKPKKPTNPDIKALFDFFHDTYLTGCSQPSCGCGFKGFGYKPILYGGRDAATLKRLLNADLTVLKVNGETNLEVLKRQVCRYFTNKKRFFAENGYDIPRFENFLKGLMAGAYKSPSIIPYEEIINDLNEVINANPGYKLDYEIKRLISLRWNDGFRSEDFKAVHRKKHASWGADPKMKKFLRPYTLYSEKFQAYLNEERSLSAEGFCSEITEHNLAIDKEWIEERTAIRNVR